MGGLSDYRVACVCGSMQFYPRMLTVADELSRRKMLVLFPFVRKPGEYLLHDGATTVTKLDLDLMHLEKIRLSDLVVVVTDHRLYVGDSTANEIAVARDNGKAIMFATVFNGLDGRPRITWKSYQEATDIA